MDPKFQSLPPLKRFRLLQQQHQLEENKENQPISLQLPAKKRKESRHPLLPEPTTTSYCLPAKKRVWALQPADLISGNPFEYKASPSSDDISANIQSREAQRPVEPEEDDVCPNIQSTEAQQKVEEEEDDGILCAICGSTDGDPTDPIVFCDGCDLMVHTVCYGNPLIKCVPEGDWFCSQCLDSKAYKKNKASPSCCLCPTKGGAMKPTTDGLWSHIVCAVFVPEAFFEDPDGRDGINCSNVPKKRWEDKCYLCKSRKGCVIECSEPKCPLAFHITCGLNEDLCIEYKQGKKEAIVAGFCKTHTELWKKQQQTGKFKIVAREEHK
ncbi:hypothetical protein JCGZ_25687 [Jatropha curcas]|uniref:Protein Jade-1 n=1 Tax=Jatropha curcas TaxID=180498 RepID=A0A067LIG5_JATCU|nr:protein Jade-1 [Jatropha curcas]KDP47178.1 hypothetical protein JCGZ_25687 [Jatropha curcas]